MTSITVFVSHYCYVLYMQGLTLLTLNNLSYVASLLQVRKLRQRKVKYFVYSHIHQKGR